jgi:hypothetical protein
MGWHPWKVPMPAAFARQGKWVAMAAPVCRVALENTLGMENPRAKRVPLVIMGGHLWTDVMRVPLGLTATSKGQTASCRVLNAVPENSAPPLVRIRFTNA